MIDGSKANAVEVFSWKLSPRGTWTDQLLLAAIAERTSAIGVVCRILALILAALDRVAAHLGAASNRQCARVDLAGRDSRCDTSVTRRAWYIPRRSASEARPGQGHLTA